MNCFVHFFQIGKDLYYFVYSYSTLSLFRISYINRASCCTFFFSQPLSTIFNKIALALRYYTPKIPTALAVVMNNEAFFQYIFIDLLHIIWCLICSICHFIGTIQHFSCSIRHFIGTIWHFFVNIRHFPGGLTAVL